MARIPRTRNYEEEFRAHALPLQSTEEHPLKLTEAEKKKKEESAPKPAPKVVDPLSAPEDDPLAAVIRSTSEARKNVTLQADSESFEPWQAKKAGILERYTTDQQLGVSVVGVLPWISIPCLLPFTGSSGFHAKRTGWASQEAN